MATLVRIKRPLSNEPAESIMVKPKRQRMDGIDEEWVVDEHKASLPASVLQRVATVTHKGENLQSDLLHTIHAHRQTKDTLHRTYKKPNVRDFNLDRETNRQHAQARICQSRHRLHDCKRGNIEQVSRGKEESEGTEDEPKNINTAEGKTENIKVAEDKAKGEDNNDEQCRVAVAKKSSTSMESDGIKYYDAELPWPKDKDVITCNGTPLESEKYVYDIYYSPQALDWTEFLCEVERYDSPCVSSSDEMPDDDDDENDENNWRNEYPEEDDDDDDDVSIEAEEGYKDRMLRYRSKEYDSDESFDADEYDEDADFDEDGSLLPYGETSVFTPLRFQLSRLKMDCEEKGARRRDDGHSDDEDLNVDM